MHEHWKKNFAFVDYYKKTLGWEKRLPKWTDADVEEFISSDPVYGPQVPSNPYIYSHFGAVSFLYTGANSHLSDNHNFFPETSLLSHIFNSGFLLATGFGALCGGVLGAEVADHVKKLYKVDKQGVNLRFLYWWEDKTRDGYISSSDSYIQTFYDYIGNNPAKGGFFRAGSMDNGDGIAVGWLDRDGIVRADVPFRRAKSKYSVEQVGVIVEFYGY
ncbi:hypothetical protein HPP92_001840 [Vanilla planifolia]|uniref:Uncharacterized protein n=1 Tax=Vanilla planifolia TaxID=51239 RepID=A0A835SDJ2_VANPL|nr:hypothetical protein HPP92_001840 [Vanilla planifolia]